MYEITKEFRFAAAHRLKGLPAGHKCARLHGHGYIVVLHAQRSDLDAVGMVFDYAMFDPFAQWLKDTLDHRYLGDGDLEDLHADFTEDAVLAFPPTAERLADYLLGQARLMCGVLVDWCEVRESPYTVARAS